MLRFEIIDHGCDGEQYFPGCGVAFTSYTDCVTGIGVSAREAGEDAYDQFITARSGDLLIADCLPLEAAVNDLSTEDDVSGVDNPEWHHYVTIRWSLS